MHVCWGTIMKAIDDVHSIHGWMPSPGVHDCTDATSLQMQCVFWPWKLLMYCAVHSESRQSRISWETRATRMSGKWLSFACEYFMFELNADMKMLYDEDENKMGFDILVCSTTWKPELANSEHCVNTIILMTRLEQLVDPNSMLLTFLLDR
jgi:hypothetical protein